MIASTRRAPRYGIGRAQAKLYVDGCDTTVHRKATVALKPSTEGQRRKLLSLLDASREVYNAALQERRDAWRAAGKRLSVFDQFKALTGLEEVRPEMKAWGKQPLRWSMRRVDEAFTAFFGRLQAGEKPGFPRFKGHGRWSTVGWDEPISWGLKLQGSKKRPVPHLYIQGVGTIPLSRPAVKQLKRFVDRGGVPTTLSLTRANREGSAWRASFGFNELPVKRTEPESGCDTVLGIDHGVAVLVAGAAADRFAEDPGQLLQHDAVVEKRLELLHRRVETLQRERARYEQHGGRWRRLSIRIARTNRKAANITENWARHTAKRLVAKYAVIVMEDLNLNNMARSARGSVEEPGRNVAAKAGLNRSLLRGAHGKQARWVRVKAEEAGRRVWGVQPAWTSRRCSGCRTIDAGARVTREVFYCGACGHYEHADVNAARNIRALGVVADTAWLAKNGPPLDRPKPRLQRHKADAVAGP